MLPLDVIKEHFPNASDEELKDIQKSVYQLCCGLMQYFYGDDRAQLDIHQAQLGDWEEDIIDPELENEEG